MEGRHEREEAGRRGGRKERRQEGEEAGRRGGRREGKHEGEESTPSNSSMIVPHTVRGFPPVCRPS